MFVIARKPVLDDELARMRRRLPLSIAPLLIVPALIGCALFAPTPPDPANLAAITPRPGADRALLGQRIETLFTDKACGETRAVIVLHDGQIVAERYGPGYDRNTRFIGWSMSKTVTGVLIGMLVADGRLRLDEPAPIPAWQRPGDSRGEITLRELLQMRSGLHHVEGGAPAYQSDEVRMLFLDGRDDMARYAESQPLEYDPGAQWVYSTNTSVILADLAARVLAPSGPGEPANPDMRRRAVAEYLRTRLFEPAGLTSMTPEYDASGTMIGGSAIHATARDWARFGEFLRQKGAIGQSPETGAQGRNAEKTTVGGSQLVPRQWIDFMTSPNPGEAQYGAQIWLNRPPTSGASSLFPDKGPADLFAAIGHLGQYVLVSPSQHLVVVRLGMTEEDRLHAVAARLGDIVALYR